MKKMLIKLSVGILMSLSLQMAVIKNVNAEDLGDARMINKESLEKTVEQQFKRTHIPKAILRLRVRAIGAHELATVLEFMKGTIKYENNEEGYIIKDLYKDPLTHKIVTLTILFNRPINIPFTWTPPEGSPEKKRVWDYVAMDISRIVLDNTTEFSSADINYYTDTINSYIKKKYNV